MAAIVTVMKPRNFFEFASFDPNSSFKDLKPLINIVGSSQLIGLGEATHGSKELIMVRHKILRFMVEKMNCKGLILETPKSPPKK